MASPSRWHWSSFRHDAYGEPDDLIADAPEYRSLGRSPAERRTAYLHLFARPLVESLRSRRPELVHGPFVGDREWVTVRLQACGLSPPG
jgi:putative transposase